MISGHTCTGHGDRRTKQPQRAVVTRQSPAQTTATALAAGRARSRQAHVRTAPRPWRDPVPAWPDSIRGSRGSLLGETCVHCNACSSRVSPRARDHNRTPVSRATSGRAARGLVRCTDAAPGQLLLAAAAGGRPRAEQRAASMDATCCLLHLSLPRCPAPFVWIGGF